MASEVFEICVPAREMRPTNGWGNRQRRVMAETARNMARYQAFELRLQYLDPPEELEPVVWEMNLFAASLVSNLLLFNLV
jgi:hypothetical protein